MVGGLDPWRAMGFTAAAPDAATGTSPQRWLVACTDPPRPERLHLGERVFGFRCASSMPSALAPATVTSRAP